MATCNICKKDLATPLDEYGNQAAPVCWDCFSNPEAISSEDEISDLEDEISDLEDQISCLEDEISYLESDISERENKILVLRKTAEGLTSITDRLTSWVSGSGQVQP